MGPAETAAGAGGGNGGGAGGGNGSSAVLGYRDTQCILGHKGTSDDDASGGSPNAGGWGGTRADTGEHASGGDPPILDNGGAGCLIALTPVGKVPQNAGPRAGGAGAATGGNGSDPLVIPPFQLGGGGGGGAGAGGGGGGLVWASQVPGSFEGSCFAQSGGGGGSWSKSGDTTATESASTADGRVTITWVAPG